MRTAVAIALCGVLIVGCASGTSSTPVTTSGPTVAASVAPASPSAAAATATPFVRPTPTPLGPPQQDIEAAGATRLEQGGDWVQVTRGSAWVAVGDGVQQLDGTSGAPKTLIPATASCTAMDVGFGRLWVADCAAGTVIAIDPTTARLAKTYSLKGLVAADEGSVAAGEGGVWVATTESSLIRTIQSRAPRKSFRCPPQAPASGPASARSGSRYRPEIRCFGSIRRTERLSPPSRPAWARDS